MKTNKEIKPFKMRCENKEEFNKVKEILTDNCIRSIACNGDEDMLINAYLYDYELVYTTFTKHFDEPEPELTYSEFMKLYGDEEVFTREDMIKFANFWDDNAALYSSEECLNMYLSERTND